MDIHHIARLARIKLTDAEAGSFEAELEAILDFVDQLNEATIAEEDSSAAPVIQPSVMRADVSSGEKSEAEAAGSALAGAAPRTRDGYVEVKAVFER